MRNKYLVLILIFISSNFILAQQPIITNMGANQAINTVLIGNGVQTSNIQFSGLPSQLGYFTNGSSFGLDTGIVISTGKAGDIPGVVGTTASTNLQSTITDIDILNLMQQNSSLATSANDAASLEFNFIPKGDTIEFQYVFGSEEYPEFVCNFNDGFAMFLSGPGINGTFSNNAVNLALVPGSNTPVSISTVNVSASTCPQANSNANLYVNNQGLNGTSIVYDGYTKVFKAKHFVQCGQTYKLKIIIADCNDHIYDSGVFLKARSLTTPAKDFVISATGLPNINSFTEQCGTAQFSVTRPAPFNQALTVPLSFAGTAALGADYISPPTSITFAAGQQTVIIPITAISDNIVEGMETIILSLPSSVCPAVFSISKTIQLKDYSNLSFGNNADTIRTCVGKPIIYTPQILTGQAISYDWSNGSTQSFLYYPSASLSISNNWYTYQFISVCNIDTIIDSVYVQVLDTNSASISVTHLVQFEQCPILDTLVVTLLNPVTIPTLYPITVSGIAANNVDFTFIDTVIQLMPGVLNYYFPYNIIQDGLGNEGLEYIFLQISPKPNMCVCSKSTTKIVNIIDSVDFKVEQADVFLSCPGQSITLTPNKPPIGILTWQPFSFTGDSYNFTSLSNDTTEILLQLNETICGVPMVAYDTAYVYPAPPTNFQITNTTNLFIQCSNPNYLLEAQITGGLPNYSYAWYDANNILLDTISSITQNVAQTSTFRLIVKDYCNRKDTVIITVSRIASPDLILSSNPDFTAQCPNQVVNLTSQAVGGVPPIQYLWSSGETTNNIQQIISDTTLLLVTAKDSCLNERRKFITIYPANYSTPALSLIGDTTVCPNQKTIITGLVNQGLEDFTFSYFTQSNNSYNSISSGIIEATINQSGYFVFKVIDACNYSSSDSIYIRKYENCNARIPNVFTSDGNGINDAFIIEHLEEYPNTHVMVYNRWGVKVYENLNYTNTEPWKPLSAVDAGTFYYVIEFNIDLMPNDNKQTGFIQVIK